MILSITLNPSMDRRYMVDGFQKGEIFRTDEYQYTPGGKGINVAKVIKTLGGPIRATGFLGGRNGHYIEEQLNHMGIENEFIYIEGETRSCLAIISDDGSQTEILETGPFIKDNKIQEFYNYYESILDQSEIICASGSLPKGLPLDTYKELILRANKRGRKFILDTSGESLRLGIEAGPYLVKPNIEELKDIIGRSINSQEDVIKAAMEIMNQGVKVVIVSFGEEGSMVFKDPYLYKIKVPSRDIISPVGSGDAMIGGIALGLLKDYEFNYILKLGSACGTANAMESETGKIHVDNVKKIIDEVEIEKIKIN